MNRVPLGGSILRGMMVVGVYGDEAVPDRCDGCGRKAASCGMVEHGWTVRTVLAGFAGSYCPDCAVALHLLPWTISCSECGSQKADEAAAERAGFRYFPDDLGGLVPFCGLCAVTALSLTGEDRPRAV